MAKNLTQQCRSCKRTFTVSVANSACHYYHIQPWFSWLEVMCECGVVNRNFFWPDYAEWTKELLEQQVGFIYEDYPESWVVEQWHLMGGPKELLNHPILPRHEKHVAYLAFLLNHLSPQDLIDCAEGGDDYVPPGLPHRWID